MIHSTAGTTSAVELSSISPRTASQTRVSGWFAAKVWSHSGIVSTGVKIELAKTNGNERDEAGGRGRLRILHQQREAA